MLIDSHCHLTDDRYQEDRWEVLTRARSADVGGVVSVASDAKDIERILALLREAKDRAGLPKLWGTAGIHPHEAEKAVEGDMETVFRLGRDQEELVGIGETGLDFFYDLSPREKQEKLFRQHLEVAESLDLPLVVHSRDADELTARILKEWEGRVRGVLHCFTGGRGLLDAALGVGWMISFTGLITFKKYDGAELVAAVPRDRLMVETDGPYLAPVPHRGRRNEPSFLSRIAETLALIRGEDPQEIEVYTTENAVSFFGLHLQEGSPAPSRKEARPK